MDPKANRKIRMDILKRKRAARTVSSNVRRRVNAQTPQTVWRNPLNFPQNVGSSNHNPFRKSVTEHGESSRTSTNSSSNHFTPISNVASAEPPSLSIVIDTTTSTSSIAPTNLEGRTTNDQQRTSILHAHKRTIFQKWDFGRPTHECVHCGAVLWYEERTVKSQRPLHPKFSMCCAEGRVVLPRFKETPPYLAELLDYNGGRRSKLFRKYIRVINSMFAFTSTGGEVDNKINDGHGPYIYRMSGQNHHHFGTLLPDVGRPPSFLQLYIVDTENEIENRLGVMNATDGSAGIDYNVVDGLKSMLDHCNPLVQMFRMARDRFQENQLRPVKIKLIGRRSNDGPQYNLPSASEVAALIVGGDNEHADGRDVIVEQMGVGLRRITEIHPSFMAMQYPLLFPYGEDFHRLDIPYANVNASFSRKRKCVTYRETFAYYLMHRNGDGQTLLRGGRLFQQFCCDGCCGMEAGRIRWVELNQETLRRDCYSGVMDHVVRGDTSAAAVGRRFILPSTFVGSPRYMVQNYQDAMAICRWTGTPDLFLTFTCNPKWNEIKYFLDLIPGQLPEDRPDIVTRVFKIKLDAFMHDLRKGEHFGKVNAAIYTIEFQKRGLPHAHILLFLKPESKRRDPAALDEIISAEIPDEHLDPVGYAAVVQFMMHSPCGAYNMNASCMDKKNCTKHYPKKFQPNTTVNADGYPIYRRRDDGRTATKNGVALDNRWVVPHNLDLVVKYDAHINVEHCNQGSSIKYLFKYINKGQDRATIRVEENLTTDGATGQTVVREVNEIQRYFNCRYLSGSESTWKGFGFDIQYRSIGVERLSFHLPGQNPVFFHDRESLSNVINREDVDKSMFTEWMTTNRLNEDARELTYPDFPTKWVWQRDTKKWTPRKKGTTIGRMYFAQPSSGEYYYLRMLLSIVKGPTCYEDIRSVDGVVYPTFKETCHALGLLDNDEEWHEVIREASHWGSGHQLRQLFVTLILFCEVSEEYTLWYNNWELLSEDILYRERRRRNNQDLTLTPERLQNYALYEIEILMNKVGRSLRDRDSLPFPDMRLIDVTRNTMVLDELSYDEEGLAFEHATLHSGLNVEQKAVYDKIIAAATGDNGGFYFVYGSGGTGKTYLWKTIMSRLRSEGKIVLAVASSGIASLLLPGGRTPHSRFKIPLKLDENSCCDIDQGTQLADLICKTCLIIWDEAPMAHRNQFEAVDRSLRDILRFTVPDSLNKPFGGIPIVLGGDFRQILPVVPRGSRQDIVSASISESKLWEECRVFKLSLNMRLQNPDMDNTSINLMSEFSKWVLDLGNGMLPGRGFGNADEPNWIKIPDDIFLKPDGDIINQIVSWTYPDFVNRYSDPTYLKDRAILSPTNDDVDTINDYMMTQLEGESKLYLSSDKLTCASGSVVEQTTLFPVEFLNTLKFSGIPNHELVLKVGVPVILLRNINPSEGLCNGTRLIVKKLGTRIIEAEVITGNNVGKHVFIHRIMMSPTDTKWPFDLQRRQFPLKVCFAMTINKSQGQTFHHVGVYLSKPVFSHGQLYVAVSRVTSREGLKILTNESEKERIGYTRNIVYHEIFNKLL